MLSLSHTTGYAILALACLERAEGAWVVSGDIAAVTGIPRSYLSRVLHTLGKAALIRAKRGYRGGFTLARPAKQISVLEVAEAVEGPLVPCCLLGLMGVSVGQACTTQPFWTRELARIKDRLARTTLAEIAAHARRAGSLRVGADPDPARGAGPKPGGAGAKRTKRKARSSGRSAPRRPGSTPRRAS